MPFFVADLIAVIFQGNKQSNTTHDDDGVTIAKWTLVFSSPKLKPSLRAALWYLITGQPY